MRAVATSAYTLNGRQMIKLILLQTQIKIINTIKNRYGQKLLQVVGKTIFFIVVFKGSN